jgi:hypothetical protein
VQHVRKSKNRTAQQRKQNHRNNELNRNDAYKDARTAWRSKTATTGEKNNAYDVFQAEKGTSSFYSNKIPVPGGVELDPWASSAVPKPEKGDGEAGVRSGAAPQPQRVKWTKSAPTPRNPIPRAERRRLERERRAQLEAEEASFSIPTPVPVFAPIPPTPTTQTSAPAVPRPEQGDGEAGVPREGKFDPHGMFSILRSLDSSGREALPMYCCGATANVY